jgi:hypothetical protein
LVWARARETKGEQISGASPAASPSPTVVKSRRLVIGRKCDDPSVGIGAS